MHPTLEMLLVAMIRAAMELHTQPDEHGPGEGGGEYTRGQAELIADTIGIPMDIAHETLMPLLYSGQNPALVASIIIKEVKEYRA